MSNRAWVTLATNDSYGLGALVLAHSLRRVSSAYPAVVLITPTVTEAMRERLRAVFAEVITVDVLDSQDAAHLAMLRRPELGITFTKIHCWNLTQYEKCVFLDADTLVVQNSDELFERDEISAAPDVGWPDCFNSGVFVFVPSADTFSRLITFAQERGSFDGGDQGLLNSFFSEWARGDINKHLPFLYNVTSAAFYSYLPALKQFGQDLKIIHFIGPAKPWLQRFNFETRTVDAPSHIQGLLQLWWDLFVNQVHTQLDVSMVEDEDEPELPPAQLPHDVSQCLYYQPVLDPESEFPWHRPDNQIVEEWPERDIVMIGVNDPWEIYRGNIPPNTKEHGTPTPHSEVIVENIEDTRKYAWDYQHQENASPRNINAQSEQQGQYWPPQSTHHHEHHSHHDIYQHHSEQQQDYSQSYQHSEQHWSHVPQNDYSHSQQSSHSYHGQSNDHHGHWHHEDQDNSHQDHQLENSHEQFHNHQSYHSDHHEQPSQSLDDHRTNESDIYNSNYNQHESQYPRNHETNKHHEHHGHSHQVHNAYKHSDTHTHAHSVEVRHIHVLPERKRKRRPRALRIDVANDTNGLMNGDLSETDSETFDEIIPRHPYDGFYLRHKATIDARGRKICTHEIPPTPSPTPSPPDSPILEDYETAEENEPSDYEEQSGVAGNLARVVPGVSTFEALDDLSRRQGWEAGNIDYMGADSFEKIWAKISQTLSTPRISPPKQVSPPIEPSALAPEEVKVQETEPTNIAPPKQVSPPIEPSSPAPEEVKVQETEPTKITPPKQVSPPIEPSSLAPKEVKVQGTEPTKKPASAPAEVVKEAVVEASAPALPIVAPVEAAVVKDSIPTKEPAKVAPAPVEVVAPATTTAAAPTPAKVAEPVKIPVAAEAAVPTAVKVADPAEVPVTVVATEAAVPEPEQKTEVAPVESVKKAAEAPKTPEVAPVSPAPAAKAPASPAKESPAKAAVAPAATDSPPLAHTPSKEEAPAVPAAKSEERRKPAGKLQLQPPAAADPLPTPDSEAEDAASLAQSIIASELRTPAFHSPTPPACPAAPASLASPKGLTVAAPEVPTPPVGGVSLAQIGVKPKEKSTIAAQIESSVAAATETPADPPKKKLVKKVAKKEGAEAPVPPPRKKEKKPKEK